MSSKGRKSKRDAMKDLLSLGAGGRKQPVTSQDAQERGEQAAQQQAAARPAENPAAEDLGQQPAHEEAIPRTGAERVAREEEHTASEEQRQEQARACDPTEQPAEQIGKGSLPPPEATAAQPDEEEPDEYEGDEGTTPTLPSTPTTPSTAQGPVEGVEGVEGQRHKPVYDWYRERPLHYNFRRVGAGLRRLVPDLYHHPDGGLLLVEAGRPRRIRSARELSPLLIDTLHIRVWKEGKRAERLSQAVLADMLLSRSFLDNFPLVQDAVTTPVVLADGTPSRPGLNPGGVLHLGPAAVVGEGLSTTNTFLDVMEFDGNASRTNAVAAALSVSFRHHWCGAKPLVLVTGKSHSGKGTLCNFIAGGCPQAHLLYQNRDWPMEQSLQRQLTERPEVGVICFDNVRLGSSGGGREIRTGLFERFITNSDVILSAAKLSSTLRTPNKYVVLLNTNEGLLSADLLNRSLHIGLTSAGDMEERLARAKTRLGGDVKTEWLPENQHKLQAELWGMIAKWRREGKPLDEAVKYPMRPWAMTIGGILMVNGFTDFLGNYQATRAAVDPVREAVGYLAFYAAQEAKARGVKALPTMELGKLVADRGLGKALLPGVDSSNPAACEREVGRRLTPYVGETFTAPTATETITYRLLKKADRWGGKNVSCRYVFEEVRRAAATGQGGVALEEQPPAGTVGAGVSLDTILDDPRWKEYQGDRLP
jgi:hypothetical protein